MIEWSTMHLLPKFWEQQTELLTRIAIGGDLHKVLDDLILMIEEQTGEGMIASILLLSDDGLHVSHGAAPNLPKPFSEAIDGAPIGPNAGSCGTAAFTGEPVYVSDIANDPLWRDYRELALPHGLAACWSVPIRGNDGTVIGTFANYYGEPREPSAVDMATINMIAQTAAIAVERHKQELQRAKAEAERNLLLRELDHRVKNAFTLAQSLLGLSAREVDTPLELAEKVSGRLQALTEAHDLAVALPDSKVLSINLHELVWKIVSPYLSDESDLRCTIDGKPLDLSPQAARAMALVMHELATNAAKYGALSVPEGRVELDWSTDNQRLHLAWREKDGPATHEPKQSGFGSRLLQDAVKRQLGGTSEHLWHEHGLEVMLDLDLRCLVSRPERTVTAA